MTKCPLHEYTMNRAISLDTWSQFREEFEKLQLFMEETRLLKQRLGLFSCQKTDSRIDFKVDGALFAIDRQLPQEWYSLARIRACQDASPIMDLFQRAALLLMQRLVKPVGVELCIFSEGTHDGWLLASRVAAEASGMKELAAPGYITECIELGVLICKGANGINSADASLLSLAAGHFQLRESIKDYRVDQRSWFF